VCNNVLIVLYDHLDASKCLKVIECHQMIIVIIVNRLVKNEILFQCENLKYTTKEYYNKGYSKGPLYRLSKDFLNNWLVIINMHYFHFIFSFRRTFSCLEMAKSNWILSNDNHGDCKQTS
jgi:hypothetical protein